MNSRMTLIAAVSYDPGDGTAHLVITRKQLNLELSMGTKAAAELTASA
jgi:hypothetical protein